MNLDIGSAVQTRDGKNIGKVDRIIFAAENLEMREFVVHQGPFFSTNRIVQRSLVDRIGDDHVVHLRIGADEAQDLPPYIEERHVAVFTSGGLAVEEPMILTTPGSAPRDAVVLSHGSNVYGSDGKHIGHLDEVVYGNDGVATAFVIDAGRIRTHDVRVPISSVKSVTHDRIELEITADEAEEASQD
ncbi:MAG: PRC-barrel domain-containing protein [Thermomicrobiales bacterium]